MGEHFEIPPGLRKKNFLIIICCFFFHIESVSSVAMFSLFNKVVGEKGGEFWGAKKLNPYYPHLRRKGCT